MRDDTKAPDATDVDYVEFIAAGTKVAGPARAGRSEPTARRPGASDSSLRGGLDAD